MAVWSGFGFYADCGDFELYLNEIYFGRGAYGVAAASLKHFGKPMQDLTLAEMTYLASVPKGPANYRLDFAGGLR